MRSDIADRFRMTGLAAVAMLAVSALPAFAQAAATPSAGAQVAAADPSATAPPAPSAPVAASCFLAPAKLSDAQITEFLAKPAALLERNPGGGLPLANEARAIAGSSSASVPALVDLAKSGSPAQQAAVGAGLARAAVACSRSDPAYAAMIQQAVAASGLPGMITAFVAASNEVQTAAIGAAAAGGGGAGGAAGIGGGGTAGGGTTATDGSVTLAQSGDLGSAGSSGGNFFGEGSSTTDSVSP